MYNFYIPDDRPHIEKIADWCNEVMPWEPGKDRRFNWFPFYNNTGHPDDMLVRFVIFNQDDAIAFKLKWGAGEQYE